MKQRLLLVAVAALAVLLGAMWYRSSAALRETREVQWTLTKNVLLGAIQNLNGMESLPPEQAVQRLVNFEASLAQAEILSLAHQKAGGSYLVAPGVLGAPLAKVKNARENLARNGSLSQSDLQYIRAAQDEIDALLNPRAIPATGK